MVAMMPVRNHKDEAAEMEADNIQAFQTPVAAGVES